MQDLGREQRIEATRSSPLYRAALRVQCPLCGRHKGALCTNGEDVKWDSPHALRRDKALLHLLAESEAPHG